MSNSSPTSTIPFPSTSGQSPNQFAFRISERCSSPTLTCDYSVVERPNTPEFQTYFRSSSTSPKTLKHILRIFSSNTPGRKGKSKALESPRNLNWEDMVPLDGDEGECIEFDEACFVDVRAVTGMGELYCIIIFLLLENIDDLLFPDIIAELPAEVGLYFLSSFLELPDILSCLLVSLHWRTLARDNTVWRSMFLAAGWMIDIKRAHSRGWLRESSQSPNWHALYRNRHILERRWTNALPNSVYTPSRQRLCGHTDSVYCVEFDSTRIITGSRDKSIKVWSAKTGALLNTFFGHLGSVLCLKFDLDWDLYSSEASGMMVSGSSDRSTIVWNLRSLGNDGAVDAQRRAVLYGHNGGVLDLRTNKHWIASCSKDGDIRVWTRSLLSLHCVLSGHSGPVNAVGLQGDRLVSASGDGRMILWDLTECKRVRTFAGHDRGLACIAFEGSFILSGSSDCTIKVWNADTGSCVRTLVGHELLVRALAVDVSAGRVVSASYDRTIKVWDLNSGRLVREFDDTHASHIFDVRFDVGKIVR